MEHPAWPSAAIVHGVLKSLWPLLLLPLVAGALASCAATDQKDESAVSASGKYGSASQLRRAAVELGYECPKWRETRGGLAPAIGLAESSGTCDGKDQFLLYGPGRSRASGGWYTAKDQVDYWQSEFGVVPGEHTLVGPNWIITLEKKSIDYESLAKDLGGKVHH